MKTTIEALSAPETAFALRLSLGPIFNWEDRLADMRRHKVATAP